ncbi:PedC/BrcD family bacteriocin maturation disulfide isomerase [Enterococcus pallens]|uniref:Bacteriocin transport accessory protein n=1 Tax=Enterococcus pallens ATCC BAA-351 TaxID=1158607 RepID=R2SD59_9ENTE|nr:PedC/BrcD family bacteriocin maturation disulfide isomerase [Enterococcus pallens]EOH90811.1 hypothetical protein UAU_03350 [Enterococcus pallens ATCC BAA-351]EOU16007.1 hypothetical protein I588_03663 [Enterococcus pallens ATCC BAA-351]OJG76301.1 hypothetical protein RV10_GL003844 [Enterococcus pallens]
MTVKNTSSKDDFKESWKAEKVDRKFVRIIALLFCGVLAATFLPQSTLAAETETTAVNMEDNYQTAEEVTEEQYLQNITGIKELNEQELVSVIKSDSSYFLYIGYKYCPHCREFSKVLNQFKSTSTLPIYYVNLEKTYGLGLSSEDQQILNSFIIETINLQYTPTFVRIEHQKPVDGFIGSATTLDDLQAINY